MSDSAASFSSIPVPCSDIVSIYSYEIMVILTLNGYHPLVVTYYSISAHTDKKKFDFFLSLFSYIRFFGVAGMGFSGLTDS